MEEREKAPSSPARMNVAAVSSRLTVASSTDRLRRTVVEGAGSIAVSEASDCMAWKGEQPQRSRTLCRLRRWSRSWWRRSTRVALSRLVAGSWARSTRNRAWMS
ncbi:hypothetical protein ACFFX0_08910 [Citricoccus parietis]|uniref:Uncharacterized protein n=1 Tax=Citricoccus parietis TaxID=592307 RepID=A0ABV5FX93_9MICC